MFRKMMEKKTSLEMCLEMHKDLRSVLSCMDGCDKEDLRDSFLISKIADLQERVNKLEDKQSNELQELSI